MSRLLIVLALLSSTLVAQDVPKVNDDTLRVDLFASEPLIQTPIGMAFDKAGRLLVIESQTHFRPKDWTGPAHDQIVWLKDTNGDGVADTREVIFADSDMTMDIAAHPDGSIYLSTRNEILRLRDPSGDGKYSQVDRKLVWMESDSRYPHNGLSGLAFDAKGGLYFGMGENLGGAYKLIGSDGKEFSDQGEGGNIWHITADGKRLARIATGFWNPFGVCVDPWGNIFATDNDPDSSPPCRLHHIIEGGDYGYQFRYGRSGLHPFISWNGELPGTLPMLAGTGEAPCDVMFYAPTATSAYLGLSEKWRGSLLVASWVDHRVESYRLTPKDGTFKAKMSLLVEGGDEFRPVAFATASDGSLYISDWVKRDYQLHGKGRVWRVSAKQPSALTDATLPAYPKDADTELRERIMYGPTPSDDEAFAWLHLRKPYLLSAVLYRMAREGEQLRSFASATMGNAQLDVTILLAARRALEFEGVPMNDLAKQMLTRGLANSDPQVVLLSLKWISDIRYVQLTRLVEAVLQAPDLTPAIYYAALTTLARLESAETSEAQLVKRLREDITGDKVPAMRRKLALQILTDRDRNVTADEVAKLLPEAATDDKAWLSHYLGTLRDLNRLPPLHELALNKDEDKVVRASALLQSNVEPADVESLIATATDDTETDAFRLAAIQSLQRATLSTEQKDKLDKIENLKLRPAAQRTIGKKFTPATRPDLNNIPRWKDYLNLTGEDVDLNNGRNVFMSTKLGGCAVCHKADGIGGMVGPNLTTIAKTSEPDYIIQSILQPNANVAPQYEAFTLVTKDGQGRTAFRLMEHGDTHTYIDIAGNTFDVNIKDIIARTPLPVSIMPEGIANRLTDSEMRDLIAYLRSLAK